MPTGITPLTLATSSAVSGRTKTGSERTPSTHVGLRSPVGRRVLFALLYFVEGAPIGYVWWALPTRLRAAEIPIAEITALSALLTIPWSAKFLWAPLVDAMRPRRAGLRGWIAGAQLVMGASLLPIVGLELDAASLGTLSTFLLVHAFAAATQDVAIDALIAAKGGK